MAKNFFSSKLLLPGGLFFLLNCYFSYQFYHVNSYKLGVMVLNIIILFLFDDIFSLFKSDSIKKSPQPWTLWFIAFLPTMGTIPGFLINGGNINYYLPIELASNLVVALWIIYIFRRTKEEKDLTTFFCIIGFTLIYASGWAALEFLGYNPYDLKAEAVSRVKSTFGNINYFAGFLTILLPVFFVLSIPSITKAASDNTDVKNKFNFSKKNYYFAFTFILGISAIYFTKTRAAIVAVILTHGLAVILFSLLAFKKHSKKIIAYLFAFSSAGLVLITIIHKTVGIALVERFGSIFSGEAWGGRFVPWKAAILAIKEAPVFGYGLGSSYNLFFKFVDPASRLQWSERSYNHAHSEILEYAQEGGLFGIFLFIIFWALIFRILYKIFSDGEKNFFLRKLVVGLFCGFLAYHIQSIFSVAPRMMVTKLPLYTLIGITFAAAKLAKIDILPYKFNLKAVQNKLVNTSIPAAVIILAVTILYPWYYSMYRFVDLSSDGSTYQNIERMKPVLDKYPNIYALSSIAHGLYQINQLDELEKTLADIDLQIQNFRTTDYLRSLMYFRKSDLKNAKKYALIAQKKDNYHTGTINVLTRIALYTNDFKLFAKQLELKTEFELRNKTIGDTNSPDKIDFKFTNAKLPLNIELGDKTTFSWNRKFIETIFLATRKSLQKMKWDKNQQRRYQVFVVGNILKAPVFNPNYLKPVSAEDRGKLNRVMSQLLRLDSLEAKELKFLGKEYGRKAKEYKRKFRRGYDYFEKTKVENEKRKIEDKIKEKYEQQANPLKKKLEGYVDWKKLSKSRRFGLDYAKMIVSIASPRQK